MKLEKLITNLHAGDKTYTRAVVRDCFTKEGEVVEYIKVYKVASGVRFPDGEFVPLFDNHGRIADFAK